MSSALILFAHGARDPAWATPLQRVRDLIQERAPGLRVELAFLEFMAPTLADCVADCHAAQLRQIQILPMFIAQGGHLKRELPEMVAHLRQQYPDLEIALAGPIGEMESVIQAMSTAALAVAGL